MTAEGKKMVTVLNSGGVAVFPTDTAYGIGCRADDPGAVEKLFRIKKRDFGKAVPLLVSSWEMAVSLWHRPLPPEIKLLMAKYWPGDLTIIYPAGNHGFPDAVYGDGNKLGLRMPDYPLLLEIIGSLGVPLIGTSANFAGGETPHQISEIDPGLMKQVDFILGLPAGSGQSTVVDLCDGIKVVRQGNVRIEI